MNDLFSTLTGWQVVIVLLALPTIFAVTVFGWMLLATSGRDHASMAMHAFGVSLNFSARRGAEHPSGRRSTDDAL